MMNHLDRQTMLTPEIQIVQDGIGFQTPVPEIPVQAPVTGYGPNLCFFRFFAHQGHATCITVFHTHLQLMKYINIGG